VCKALTADKSHDNVKAKAKRGYNGIGTGKMSALLLNKSSVEYAENYQIFSMSIETVLDFGTVVWFYRSIK
jgi:hypothetical protein